MVDNLEVEIKKLRLEDTNMANHGTELELQVKKAAAETEKEWENMQNHVGVKVWRIEKFTVQPWPKEQYGNFYSGDSYLVLFGEKDKDGIIHHHAHMWVGDYTTQDEAGTAAYKVVELDTFLDRKATLYRDVQNNECSRFITYFNNRVNYMNGGIETGFKHVTKEEYKPRLFHIMRNDKVYRIKEVTLTKSSLVSDDCFVLDNGLTVYQFNGEFCSQFEKFKAAAFCQDIKNQRHSVNVVEINEKDDKENKEFWDILGGKSDLSKKDKVEEVAFENKLVKFSDESGTMVETLIATGKFSKSQLDSKDLFFVDTKDVLFIWIGKDTSKNEKRDSLGLSIKYLKDNNRPVYTSVCIMNEGKEVQAMFDVFEK